MFKQTLAHKPRCFGVLPSLLIGTLVLSGCGSSGFTPLSKSSAATRNIQTPQTETVILDAGSITISPPPGFCKDANSSKSSELSAFFLFANCGNISTNGKYSADGALFSGVVTTSISKSASFQNETDIATISEFLSSSDGLKTLSTSGNANAVSIVDKRQSTDAVFIQIADQNAPISQNVWKSFVNRENHLVTITMLKDKGDKLTDEQAMQFLQSYSETITSNNELSPVQPSIARQQIERSVEVKNTTDGHNKLKKVGLLRRLLL
ncbi:hypothetical protein F9L33_08220 [Amylibacter sp. SFDW26]|uniref:hypothetical protein n=1 Tax=Amylibacter sp. SFDW26 TaxID=2652722 RepID=UPI001261A65D|nr:hypothetical protein [Amylibacter sp. SFDW26]KAB7614612.1 hypothetical protein F9L33_08220 [Amylibacter sp. SFDW26]